MSNPTWNQPGESPVKDQVVAPYNFVPLSSWIWFPDWGPLASLDFPFSDGLSGTLELTVRAKTPILIGDGGTANPDQSKLVRFKKRADGKFAIPGTSLKGMARAVTEILTFSRMRLVDDKVFAFRDLYDNSYRSRLADTSSGFVKPLARAGWLRFENRVWRLYPTQYARVEQQDVGRYLKSKGKTAPNFSHSSIMALDKYRALPPSETIAFDLELEERKSKSNPNLPFKLSFQKAVNLGGGAHRGRVIFTGWMSRKHLEFVFYGDEMAPLPVSNEQFDKFRYVHQSLSESGVFDYLSAEYKKGAIPGIPVFYLPDAKGAVDYIGLAQMPRLRHRFQTHDLIRRSHHAHLDENGPLDMAELLFGALREQGDSLRGRIGFDDAVAVVAMEMPPSRLTVQAQPKASYHPAYLLQQARPNGELSGSYKTYSSQDSKIRGWKRYPVRVPAQKMEPPSPESDTISKSAQVQLQPLKQDTEFKGKVRFHNLRPEELGALLWVLTWGGKPQYRHSLGLGKAFGWGQVALEVALKEVIPNDPDQPLENDQLVDSCMDAFEKSIDRAYQDGCKKRWMESAQVTQLLAMADPARSVGKQLSHMPLADFARMKNNARGNTPKVLRPYAEGPDTDAFRDNMPLPELKSAQALISAQITAREQASDARRQMQEQEEQQREAEAKVAAEREKMTPKARELDDWLSNLVKMNDGEQPAQITAKIESLLGDDTPLADRCWFAEQIVKRTKFLGISNPQKLSTRKAMMRRLKGEQ